MGAGYASLAAHAIARVPQLPSTSRTRRPPSPFSSEMGNRLRRTDFRRLVALVDAAPLVIAAPGPWPLSMLFGPLSARSGSRTYKILEKYNLEATRPGGNGECPTQDGFGCTNGVARAVGGAVVPALTGMEQSHPEPSMLLGPHS